MGESLLTAYIDVAVRDGQAVAGLAKVETTAKKTFNQIDRGSQKSQKEFSLLFGKAGDAAELFERRGLRMLGGLGKAFGAGGLAGLGLFEAIHALPQLFDQLTGISEREKGLKELADSMKKFRMETIQSLPAIEKLRDNLDAALPGAGKEQGQRMLEAVDKQMESIRKKRSEAIQELGKSSELDIFQKAAETPEGAARYAQLFQRELASRGVTRNSANAEQLNEALRAAGAKFRPEARDFLSGIGGMNADIRDLEKRRNDIIQKTGAVGDQNPFLKGNSSGSVFLNPAEQANKIQEAIFGTDAPASEKGQKEIVEAIEALGKFGAAVGGVPAVWGA